MTLDGRIINEKKFVEDNLINNVNIDLVNTHPIRVMSWLASYFIHENKFKPRIVKTRIEEFMTNNYHEFDMDDWEELINSIIVKSKKKPLNGFSCVPITDKELNLIKSLGDSHQEKILFTLLCYAKFYNTLNPNNNNWCNCKNDIMFTQLLKDANSSVSLKQSCYCLHRPLKRGYIAFTKKSGNCNMMVNIVDNSEDSKVIYEVTSMKDLGNQYMVLVGRGIFCKKCGKFESIKSRGTRRIYYCKEHRQLSTYQKLQSKTKVCIDCGKEFTVPGNNKRSIRCPDCQKAFIKANKHKNKK